MHRYVEYCIIMKIFDAIFYLLSMGSFSYLSINIPNIRYSEEKPGYVLF